MAGVVRVEGRRLVLRDLLPEDVEARVRWGTVETEWLNWDAPWEGPELTPVEVLTESRVKRYAASIAANIAQPLPSPRTRLWVERIAGPLLGWVNSYHHDESDRSIWVGINVAESAFWNQGLGTEALLLWTGYLFQSLDLRRVRLGTWSGNRRMVRCAGKCGFVLVNRTVGNREVRGKRYDGLEFELVRAEWLQPTGAEEA